MAHPPPSLLVGHSPNPPRVGGRLGWDGGWTTSPGTRLIWVRSWFRGGYAEYRTPALANCPHQTLGEQSLGVNDPQIRVQSWVLAASIQVQMVKAHRGSDPAPRWWVPGSPRSGSVCITSALSLLITWSLLGPGLTGHMEQAHRCPGHPVLSTPREPRSIAWLNLTTIWHEPLSGCKQHSPQHQRDSLSFVVCGGCLPQVLRTVGPEA